MHCQHCREEKATIMLVNNSAGGTLMEVCESCYYKRPDEWEIYASWELRFRNFLTDTRDLVESLGKIENPDIPLQEFRDSLKAALAQYDAAIKGKEKEEN